MSAVLEGVKVLDFTRMHAGAGGTRILANFGADVIRIEWPFYPALDFVRLIPPFGDGVSGINRSLWFNSLNVGKQSMTVDAQSTDGRAMLFRLATEADIVAENFSADVMDGLGLGYEDIRKVNENVIYVSQSGFGHSGPYKHFRTFGPTAQAFAGLTISNGLPGHPPAGWGYSYMDHMAAFMAAYVVAAALNHRLHTGVGQFIDLSQAQAACTLTGVEQLDFSVNKRRYTGPSGNHSRHPRHVPHNSYRCAGGGLDDWCVIDVQTDDQWRALIDAMGSPPWSQDSAYASVLGRLEHEAEIDELIEQWTVSQTKFEVMERLQSMGVPCGAVQNASDKFERDPQLAERGFYVRVPHPEVGEHHIEGPVAKMSKSPPAIAGPAPMIGEHTRLVCRERLGMSDDEVSALIEQGVLTDVIRSDEE